MLYLRGNYKGAAGIHDIHPVLKRYSKPAKEILGEEAYNYFYNQKLEFWKSNIN